MNPQNTTLGLHEPLRSKTLRVSDTVRLQISACLAPVTGKLGKPAHHGTEPGKSHFLFSDAPSPEGQLHHYSLTCLCLGSRASARTNHRCSSNCPVTVLVAQERRLCCRLVDMHHANVRLTSTPAKYSIHTSTLKPKALLRNARRRHLSSCWDRARGASDLGGAIGIDDALGMHFHLWQGNTCDLNLYPVRCN